MKMTMVADDAAARIGSMLVNPGGPGFGGTTIPENAEWYVSETLRSQFDIIGWDPRGTGLSTPAVDCIDDYDPYFGIDSPPNDEAAEAEMVRVTQEFVDLCIGRSGDILPYISTEASARDMDAIRAALGEEKITYFGFSYGSE
ncbi:MAG: alpha/beta fold hydrolase, partial [Actinobacteria bacterium]|nr:alpha/beta fold hydrolase [Actinomycetota bacterium]